MSWFPYEEGSTIYLENKAADTLLPIPIDYVRVYHKTHYTTGTDCGNCDDNIDIGSKEDFSISVFIEKNKIKAEHYYIKGVGFYEDAVMLDKYTFNNKEYEQVKIFENTDNNSKLIVAQNFGVIAFIDKDGNEWVLIENNVTQKAKPNITNSACD
ncbi:hypothetical protein FACS189434_03350 [Bacteroidia bacterium]|nr:hypothetical protein FACS189434_03350 [Bacteroidia bacterium]